MSQSVAASANVSLDTSLVHSPCGGAQHQINVRMLIALLMLRVLLGAGRLAVVPTHKRVASSASTASAPPLLKERLRPPAMRACATVKLILLAVAGSAKQPVRMMSVASTPVGVCGVTLIRAVSLQGQVKTVVLLGSLQKVARQKVGYGGLAALQKRRQPHRHLHRAPKLTLRGNGVSAFHLITAPKLSQ